MNKSESIKEIVAATIAVMKEVKGIDKTMTIGTGNSAYKGVSDKEVKKIIGDSMQKNGLAIFPIGISENVKVSEWEESGQYGTKHKQSIFSSVVTTYLLTHTSGEFIEISGYGHGVDSQDKSAGKATTYALKYALLYTFMVPTGTIDDADKTHSDEMPVPQQKAKTQNPERAIKPGITDKALKAAIKRALSGEPDVYKNLIAYFTLTTEQINEFQGEMMNAQ